MNLRFENDVKTYSIQTFMQGFFSIMVFENDVKTYSIQTGSSSFALRSGLRMM